MITLSAEQEECKAAVHHWAVHQPQQTFLVTGYAGTGKTSTIVPAMQELEGETLYAAFTGKAALVMQSKGCTAASTIHKLIYLPGGSAGKEKLEKKEEEIKKRVQDFTQEGLSDEEARQMPQIKKLLADIEMLNGEANSPIFRLNPDSPIRRAARVVIDECSMLDHDITKDLLSFGTPILVQGDMGQLPPVAGEGYFLREKPNFNLTQIHRQAADSPIIKLATWAREKVALRPNTYGESSVVTKITPEMALEADQILCGRNSTRHLNNARVRQLKGFSGPWPQPGEKLVCLRNNHEKGLLNGSLWTVVKCHPFGRRKLSLTVKPEEGGPAITVLAHNQYFTAYGDAGTPHGSSPAKGPNGKLTEQWVVDLLKAERSIGFEMREAENFTFGYVLTVHKAQGSQWNDVLVLDESSSFGADASKHLYTAVTRAARKVTVRL